MSTEAPQLTRPEAGKAVALASPTRVLSPPRRYELGSVLPPYPAHALLDATAPRTRVPLVFGLVIFVVFVVGFGAWAGLAPLAEASIAPGLIKVEGSRRVIQHLEGGIVREILVRDGVKVTAGQVLMRLEDVQADAGLETQRAQRWALLAQDARLAAEIAGARAVAFPADLLASELPRAVDSVAGQRALFEARSANLNSQLLVLRSRIEQQESGIVSDRGQLTAARRQLDLIRQEERVKRDLMNQGLSRLSEVLALQRNQAAIEGNIQDYLGRIERSGGSIAEARQQIQQTIDQRRQEVATELRDVRGKLAETEERLRAATDSMTRRDIVAPETGIIVNLRIFTLGAVLKPGDPVMELVPEQDRLVAEVNVQPTDIDVVYPGLQSEIRLPAFKQRLVPFLNGQVTWVAADVTTNDQTRQQYYRAYVLIDRDQLARLPDVFLTPGMPVEAHIQIGQRTFFRYMTQPIRDSFNRAFREQ